jgi:diaminohydroxyphosphoribosylaminopyrimidine deaminase/5-amino-6-(5-phosphoribosylamino)uracil reductase
MPPEKEELLRERNADVWRLVYEDGSVDLHSMLSRLASEGIDSVLVEGGGETAASFLRRGLVDKVSFIIAPIIIGGRDSIPAVAGEGVDMITSALRLSKVSIRRFGDDVMINGYPETRS